MNDSSDPAAPDNETKVSTGMEIAALEETTEDTKLLQTEPANQLQEKSDQVAGGKKDASETKLRSAEEESDAHVQKVKGEASDQDPLSEILTRERPAVHDASKSSLGTNKASIAGANTLPARDYLETVVPALRQCLRSLLKERPEDPIGFLADYFNSRRAK